MKSSLIAVSALALLASACNVDSVFQAKSKKNKSNRVTNESQKVNEIIGDENVELQVINEAQLKEMALSKSILSISNPKTLTVLNNLPDAPKSAESIAKSRKMMKGLSENTLYVGFPIGMIGEQNVFGGVITKVTDKENENLGGLKLTDLSPLHVRSLISRMPDGNPALTLVGCAVKCTEDSEQNPLLSIPIVGFNQEAGMLILDLAAIGRELDFISMIDPKGEYTQLKAISSETTEVDYDLKTLVFDIKTKMIPVKADPNDPSIQTTDFTTRWYLKLGSGFNPAFVSRSATEGVGFFGTSRSADEKITRFSTTSNGTDAAPVKYYIKNVPNEFKKAFARAMDSWNVEFKKTLGKDLISYEFVDKDDARSAQLVPGDIRYNIIEWDLENKAGYGGLGPSIANQHTGETLSANVLVQGPTIVELYSKWFEESKKINTLLAQGETQKANELSRAFNVAAQKELSKRNQTQFKVKLGKSLDMTVHSQREHLEDPIIKGHFEVVPAGMTYETYMEGYMLEIVAHEVGHNLGLRHNFKGNLGAVENGEEGSVSRSVMEYLGRGFRYLNTIGSYDRMAIAYGYKGATPKHKNWFCTDEDQGYDKLSLQFKSPECSKSDATSDPFSFWESRLNRVIELVLETKSNSAPVWKVDEVASQLDEAITGITAYALSAERTADSWTNFFGKFDRPETKEEVKEYVLMRIKKKLCSSKLQDVINSKESAEAQKLAQENLDAVLKAVAAKAASFELYTAEQLNCKI
ncbi:zinc-dependent metalloprotease [Peredibacter sp. HCB2-198]|uniref:zinc-dependent metalloprotease n=1 Tax=Peredibacter sp. HCB2-198 TaxID=3383025 RepID=UPI0038B52060